jgi:hypothetical protein
VLKLESIVVVGLLALALAGCGDGKSAPRSGTADAANPAGDDSEVVLTRDQETGVKYGAPGPRTCSTDKVPANGRPSAAVIAKYVICGREAERPTEPALYLVDQVQITAVSNGRPYNPNEDVNMGKIDITAPIYDISGSLVSYHCNRLQEAGGAIDFGADYKQGTQCSTDPEPKATGACYLNTLHQWSCSLLDVDAITRGKHQTPPPPAD